MCLFAAPQSVALPVKFWRGDALVGRDSVEPLSLSPLKTFYRGHPRSPRLSRFRLLNFEVSLGFGFWNLGFLEAHLQIRSRPTRGFEVKTSLNRYEAAAASSSKSLRCLRGQLLPQSICPPAQSASGLCPRSCPPFRRRDWDRDGTTRAVLRRRRPRAKPRC
jgi:hypothetical protein